MRDAIDAVLPARVEAPVAGADGTLAAGGAIAKGPGIGLDDAPPWGVDVVGVVGASTAPESTGAAVDEAGPACCACSGGLHDPAAWGGNGGTDERRGFMARTFRVASIPNM